ASAAGCRARGGDGCRAARHARGHLPGRGKARAASAVPGDRRFHQPLYRSVRYRVGDHEFIPWSGHRAAGNTGHGSPGHCRSPDRHGHRSVRRESGGSGLYPLLGPCRDPDQPLLHLRRRVLQHPASPRAHQRRGVSMYTQQGRRQKRKPVAEMNVVPYIDVMLVLLVIFMVTAPMLNQGVKVDLPQVASEVLPSDSNQQVLTLSVLADGTYYWNPGETVDTENRTETAISLEEMSEGVAKIMRARPDTLVYIRGDREVSYGVVVAAMADLQQSGVPTVGLITEAP